MAVPRQHRLHGIVEPGLELGEQWDRALLSRPEALLIAEFLDLPRDTEERPVDGQHLMGITGALQQAGRFRQKAAGVHMSADFRALFAEVKRIVPGVRYRPSGSRGNRSGTSAAHPGTGVGEFVDDRGWPMAVILGVKPELRFVRLAPTRIVVVPRQGRIVLPDVPGFEHLRDHSTVQPLKQLRALRQPLGHQGTGELDPEAGETAGNAIQR